MQVMARPVQLVSHTKKFMGFSREDDEVVKVCCDADKCGSYEVWVIFPLDSGCVCLKNVETGRNLQMRTPKEQGQCYLDN